MTRDEEFEQFFLGEQWTPEQIARLSRLAKENEFDRPDAIMNVIPPAPLRRIGFY